MNDAPIGRKAKGWQIALFLSLLLTLGATAQEPDPDLAALRRALSLREAFVGSDARLLGFGSAGVALSEESEGAWWNPAALSSRQGIGFSLAHHPMSTRKLYPETGIALDANLDAFGLTDAGAVGAASWLSGWGVRESKHRVYGLSYASPKEYGVSVGVGIRRELHYLQTGTLSGWGLDAGAHFDHTFPEGQRLLLGLSLMNAGMRLSGPLPTLPNNGEGGVANNDGEGGLPNEATPLTVRGGIAYESPVGALVAADMAYFNDRTRVVGARYRLHLGGEYPVWREVFALRMGYNTGLAYDQIGRGIWSLGASAKRNGGRIDYAFTTGKDGRGESVESRHLLMMTLDWTPPVPAPKRGPAVVPATTEDVSLILPDAPIRFVRIENDVLTPGGKSLFHLTNLPASWRLEIRDGAGQLVRSFDSPTRSATAELAWDGKNAQGKSVPDGLYIWQLTAGKPVLSSVEGTPDADLLAKGAVTIGKPVVPKAQPSVSPTRVIMGNVSVLAGSFRDRERAETILRSLASAGFGSSARIEEAQLPSGKWYRVLVGDFTDRAGAEPLRKMVAEALKVEAVIFSRNP